MAALVSGTPRSKKFKTVLVESGLQMLSRDAFDKTLTLSRQTFAYYVPHPHGVSKTYI